MLTVEELVEEIENSVRGGRTPTEAYKKLSSLLGENGKDTLRQARIIFEQKTNRIRTLKDPPTLTKKGLQDWYAGPSSDDIFWPALKKHLLEAKGWDGSVVDVLDDASTKIISLLQPAGKVEIDTRGLVVGYVQSGKTANFTAVLAKAADVNYKLFIVLSGMTKNLRNQTQERLDEELMFLSGEHWFALTKFNEDFRPGSIGKIDAFLTDKSDVKLLAVVKKNVTVLRKLYNWLKDASKIVLNNCPVLIIDDEADQASINASRYADKRTAINKLILDIIELLPKSAYIGYTATPFANVFIDPAAKDLYPRDFIVTLPKPAEYFGAERIFGRERLYEDDSSSGEIKLDMIRIVPADETQFLQPRSRVTKDDFDPELTDTLKNSLRYFWLAAAARLFRGQVDEHITMLIHTSVYTTVHQKFLGLVEQYRNQILTKLQSSEAELIEQLKSMWEEEQQCVQAADFGELAIAFENLKPYLMDVLRNGKVIVDNSLSEQRLLYKKNQGSIQIVIGGDTLSRGLTLEGLTVSFFIRTASAYDTLLQMGRWFGYRSGYADLTRMWMTHELAHYFYDLATVEEEMRTDIRRYQDEDLTPLDFAVRIRTHPSLSITSELKMQDVIDAAISYNNTRQQTIWFKRLDASWLKHNIEAVKKLTAKIVAQKISFVSLRGENILFRNVPATNVIDFLNDYKFHEERRSLSSNLLTSYIRELNKHNDLLSWNIVIRSATSTQPIIDLGSGIQVHTIVRTRRNKPGKPPEDADVGVLMSRGDRIIDLENLKPEDLRGKKDEELQSLRINGIGLLIIYPISKDSPATGGKTTNALRLSMEAVEHVIGLGIVFPKSQDFEPQTYKMVNLSNVPREEIEWDFEQEESD